MTLSILGCIALEQAGPQRLQMQVYPTDCSSNMVAGNLSQPKMATSKILLKNN